MKRTLAGYLAVKHTNALAIQQISEQIASLASMEEAALLVKALEVIDEGRDSQAFSDAVTALLIKVQTLPTTTPDDLIFLARVTQLNEHYSLGQEAAFKEINDDRFNVDHNGDIVVGTRKLEHFGDKVLETFY